MLEPFVLQTSKYAYLAVSCAFAHFLYLMSYPIVSRETFIVRLFSKVAPVGIGLRVTTPHEFIKCFGI